MAVSDIDGTTKNMFGISVGTSRVDIRSNGGAIEVRNNLGVFRKVQTQSYMAVSAPTINHDASIGILVTDEWFDTVTNKKYICKDNTTGAAVWQELGVVQPVGSRILWVDGNRTDSYVAAGTMTYPYKTIQAALTFIGNPVDGEDAERVYTVMVEGGIYDEELTIPEGRMIILAALGGVVLGLNTFPVVTPRSINYLIDTTKRKDPGGGIGSIRPELSIVSLPSVKSVGTHIGRINAWYITGNINKINSANDAGKQATHDILLKGVKIDGLLQNAGTAAVGQSSIYAEDVQFVGGIAQGALGAIHLQEMTRCVTNAAISAYKFGLVRETKFGAAITVTGAISADYSPVGFFNCDFGSTTFTGPANSFKCDAACINLPTLSGGATLTLIDDSANVKFTPAVAGNWTSSPVQVKAALDELGARASGAGSISTNTTLYVATTGSDVTGNGTIGTPWATPHKAIAYLKDKIINTDVTVTIQCADGDYALGTQLLIEHPYGDRIIIQGTNVYSKTLTSIQSSSGSAGNWSMVVNLSNVTNIAVGDWVFVRSTTGAFLTNNICGVHVVTNVDTLNSRITFTSYNRYASAPTGAVNAPLYVVKTRFIFSSSVGILANKAGIQLAKLGIRAVDYYIRAQYGGRVTVPGTEVVVCNGTSGMMFDAYTGGLISGTYVGASGTGTTGFRSIRSSMIDCSELVSTGHMGMGCLATGGGSIICSSGRILGCNLGVWSTFNSNVTCPAIISCNTTYNLLVDERSFAYASGATINYGTTGIYASGGAWVVAQGVSYTGNGTDTNPVVNTVGNEQAYIDA